MRVVAGLLGSRVFEGPPKGVRPTSDRVRESLFARLGDLSGCSVLDLFAGTGSLGIEAISRGASSVTFVDRAQPSIKVLKKNLDSLQIGRQCTVMRSEVRLALRRLANEGRQFDLIFMDPPYAEDEYGPAFKLIADSGLLSPGGALVVESAKRHPLPSVAELNLEVVDERATGDTLITQICQISGEEMANQTADGTNGASGASEQSSGSRATVTRNATVGLFPASFDPPTNGHIDLIERAQKVFDEVVVAVAINVGKTGTFSFEERIEMLNHVTESMEGVRVEGFSGLMVEHAHKIGATVIIRGLRAIADFEYEFEMTLMNQHLQPELETLFMMTKQEYLYVSSSRLKELVRFGANIEDFVPPLIAKRLVEKLG